MALFEQKKQQVPSNLLKDKFGWPPFSILNTISWDWQRRKDEWEVLFKDSTAGRDVKRYNATPTNTFSARGAEAKTAESVSEFDPFLTELMLRWFTVPNSTIFDPFAGGCVRGVVSAVLGHEYIGVDISPDQVAMNRSQYEAIQQKFVGISGKSTWLCGDSYDTVADGIWQADMVLTCPPYYNLERYTNIPGDLSCEKTYEGFLDRYSHILLESAKMLKDDAFFVIVVSEIRKNSADISESQYLGFVPDTIKILQNSPNLLYYNDIVLENAIGSLPIRAPKYFDRTRKIGRHHQNILVFYKGNPANIEAKYGPLSR